MKWYNRIKKEVNSMKKIFSLFILSVVLFVGCADKDAYSKFELLKDQEVAFDNVTLAKIIKGTKVDGVFSALYLNAVYPNRYDKETFYLIVFSKNKRLLENFEVSLNKNTPVSVVKLPPNNEYSHLLDIKNDWSHYYLVRFASTEAKKLQLALQLSNAAKATVTFQKNR